jgi:hypothetical protein
MNIIVRSAMSPWSAGVQNNPISFRPMPARGGNVRLMAGGPLISTNQLNGYRMGQAEAPLSQADRNSILSTLNTGWTKAASIDAWRAAHPNWQADLGADADSFIQMSNNAGVFVGASAKVRQALQSSDPATWAVSTQDLNDASSWAVFMDGLYDLVKKHTPAMPPPPVSQAPPGSGAPPPVVKPDYTMPIVIGGAAILLAAVFA